MVCRRVSALLLSSALLACSREPPPPAPREAPDVGSAAPALAPSSSLAPIAVSPLIRAVATVDPRNYSDKPVSIPGVLTIRAPALDTQSHGVGLEPWSATFLVTNETTAPLTVQVSDLVYRSDDASVPPEYWSQPLAVKGARAEGVAVPVEGGKVSFTVPPRRQIEVDLDGDLEQYLRTYYRAAYIHEAVFSVGGARVVGSGYTMHFRYPRADGVFSVPGLRMPSGQPSSGGQKP